MTSGGLYLNFPRKVGCRLSAPGAFRGEIVQGRAALRKVSARKGGNERFFAEIAGFFALSLDFAEYCARITMLILAPGRRAL